MEALFEEQNVVPVRALSEEWPRRKIEKATDEYPRPQFPNRNFATIAVMSSCCS